MSGVVTLSPPNYAVSVEERFHEIASVDIHGFIRTLFEADELVVVFREFQYHLSL